MSLPTLAWRYLWSRPLQAALNLLLLALGLATSSFLLLVQAQIERGFERDLAGIDAVVGAKGSPLQLILAGVFHIDVAPGNIDLQDVLALRAHPQVAQVMALSLGDAYQGYRIVGSEPEYLAHYGARMAQGRVWGKPMEAVLGAQVAVATGMAIGAHLAGSHGLAQGGADHDEAYEVVGLLAPCACVLDRLVLTAHESVWQVHEKHSAPAAVSKLEGAAGAAGAASAAKSDAPALQARREVTVALVRYHTPLAAATFPRHVNRSTAMQAAAPAIELSRLFRMLGVGGAVLKGFAWVLLLSAALGVFVALWNAVRERQADLAMLRMLGAPPARLATLVLCEAMWLAALGCVMGLALGHGLASAVGYGLEAQRSVPISGWAWASGEIWLPLGAALMALLAAGLPTLAAYRVDVSQLLDTR